MLQAFEKAKIRERNQASLQVLLLATLGIMAAASQQNAGRIYHLRGGHCDLCKTGLVCINGVSAVTPSDQTLCVQVLPQPAAFTLQKGF
jgi:hypothetical protein